MKVKKNKNNDIEIRFSETGIAYRISKDGTISVHELDINSGDEESIEDFELLSLCWNNERNRFDVHSNNSDILISN